MIASLGVLKKQQLLTNLFIVALYEVRFKRRIVINGSNCTPNMSRVLAVIVIRLIPVDLRDEHVAVGAVFVIERSGLIWTASLHPFGNQDRCFMFIDVGHTKVP